MLGPRVGTAIVLFILAWFVFFHVSLQTFALSIGFLTLIGAWELAPMSGVKSVIGRLAYVGLVAALEAAIWLVSDPFQLWPSLSWPYSVDLDWPFIVLVIGAVFWLVAIIMVLNYPNQSFWKQSQWGRLTMGILVLVPCWVGFISIRATDYVTNFNVGGYWLFSACLIVWGADSGAYFSGRAFGKNKLSPNVSPGKTWEGVYGGLVTALLLLWGALVYFELSTMSIAVLLIALVTGVVSVFGDLFESMLKRNAGIKDSGKILPGHGGVMDRIDGLAAAIPVFALLMGTI